MQRKIGPLSSCGPLVILMLAATLTPAAFAGGQVPTYGNPVSSCSGDLARTTVTGTVYVPNGMDPLPNALVYIPSSAPGALTHGVECLQAGAFPQGGAVTSTTTAADGTFTLPGVPDGTNIPIVIQSGKWRIQRVISTVTPCTNTVIPAALTTLASNHDAGDIPKIAIVTGNKDAIECILRKTGVLDSEFTNPSGSGRINLYLGGGAAGVQIDASTPSESTLVSSASMLNNYDVILFPSQGTVDSATSLSTNLDNVYDWANSGGRLFASHSSFGWLYNNPTSTTGFGAAVQWNANQDRPTTTGDSNQATVSTAFSGAATLSTWLGPTVLGSTTLSPAQVTLPDVFLDQIGVVPPTQAWLTLSPNANLTPAEPAHSVMALSFNTPVGASAQNQCGRVFFADFDTVNVSGITGQTYPSECDTNAMTAEEHAIEYSLFDLSNFVTPVVAASASHTFPNSPASFMDGDSADQIAIHANPSALQSGGTSLLGLANAYNLISLTGNISDGADITGRIAAADQVTQATTVGTALRTSDPYISLASANGGPYAIVAGGGIPTSNSFNVNAGGNVYTSLPTSAGFNLANEDYAGSLYVGSSLLTGGTSPIDFSSLRANMLSLSGQLSGLAANGVVCSVNNSGSIVAGGGCPSNPTYFNPTSQHYSPSWVVLYGTSATTNIFDLTQAQFQSSNNLDIEVPTGSTVIINVAGTSDTLQRDIYFQGNTVTDANASSILFNFASSTSLTINGKIDAAVLAPNASLTGGDQMGGVFIAASIGSTGEVHYDPFGGTLSCSNAQAPLTIACAAVNIGTVGVAFDSGPMAVTGGTAPYTFSVVGTLPAGLTLNTSTGEITGTPTASGIFSVKVTDASGATGTACAITINARLSVTCAAVNAGTVGVAFDSGPMAVTGGTAPYTFSVVGTVPAGLTLNTSTGEVTGTATTSGIFSLEVTDSKGVVGSTTCSITIGPGYTLTVNPSSVTVVAGQPATTTFTFTPVGGFVGTVSFSCSGLPAGATCTFAPPSVTANGSNTVQTSTLTITTTASGTAVISQNRTTPGPTLAAAFFLPSLLLGSLLAWRRRSFTVRMRGLLLLLLVGTTLVGGAIGCGEGILQSITPLGTHVVTVVAKANVSGTSGSGSSSTQTAAFDLIVIP